MIIIVEEILRYFNDTNRVDNEHSTLYLNIAQVGAFDTYYGADFLLAWYNRNIRIFCLFNIPRILGVDIYEKNFFCLIMCVGN